MEYEVNLGDVKLGGDFEPMPAGWYSTTITKLEFKPTKAKTGEYLSAEFTVYGEQYEKRKVFHMYNLVNPNAKAVEIGLQQLKVLLIETGSDEAQLGTLNKEKIVELLMNKKVGIRLKVEVSEQYGDKNVIVGYKMIEEDLSKVPF